MTAMATLQLSWRVFHGFIDSKKDDEWDFVDIMDGLAQAAAICHHQGFTDELGVVTLMDSGRIIWLSRPKKSLWENL